MAVRPVYWLFILDCLGLLPIPSQPSVYVGVVSITGSTAMFAIIMGSHIPKDAIAVGVMVVEVLMPSVAHVPTNVHGSVDIHLPMNRRPVWVNSITLHRDEGVFHSS
ncbi:hypothetical protein B0H11DRAFT_1914322 [Mycena galericulata]|nr:hypothetical protein B0H11DRAFT_1914322 [Mycena galericulata]